MVKGLKQTSQTVAIGFRVTEPAPNTFTEGAIDLNLSPLDREVFVVTAINLDNAEPDGLAGTNTRVTAAVTTTSQAATGAVANLSNPNCLATASLAIRAAGFVDSGVGFTRLVETPAATQQLDYIGIIATNDFFVQVIGDGNAVPKGTSGKLYGYRAVADASIYSALVQSEVLSA